MRHLKQICLLMFLLPVLGFARGSLSGYCTQGGQKITTNAIPSTTQVMQSYPQCQISVFYTGGPSGSVTTSGTAVTWASGTLFNANGQWSGQTITINSIPYQIQSCASQTACTLTGSAGTQSSPVAYSMATTTLAAIFTSNGTAQTNPFVSSLQGYWQFYGDNGQYDIKLSGGGIPAPFIWGAQDLIDPTSLPNTVSDLVCTTTNCLASLCITATARKQTLLVSRMWDLNGTCAASQYDYSGGGWCPSSGHTTVLSGAFDGDLTQHVCTYPAGNISFTGPVAVFYPEWFGGKGDYNGSGTDNCPAFTALSSIGRSIVFSKGQYFSSCGFSTSIPTMIRGAGAGVNVYTAANTAVIFASGSSGFTFALGSRGSLLEGVWVHSMDTGSNSDHGVELSDSFIEISHNAIDKFGADGVFCSASDNCDNQYVHDNILVNNFANGWHCGSTSDCNVGVIQNNRTQGNSAHGFYLESGGPNTFIANDSTETVSYDMSGHDNVFINPYCEASALFNLRGSTQYVESPSIGGCTFHDFGLGANRIVIGHVYQDPVGIAPQIDSSGLPSSPTYYVFRSGVVGDGCLNLHDETNNQDVYHYCPDTSTFTFDVGIGSPITSYSSSSAGAGSENAIFNLDGQNGGGTEVHYGKLSTYIQNNSTLASDTCISTQEANSLTKSLCSLNTGAVSIVKVYTIGTLPTCDGVAPTPSGAMVNISNGSNSASYMGSVSATGTTFIQVMCTGASGWKYH